MEKSIKILPIYIEGDPILKQICEDIAPSYVDLKNLVESMHITLDATKVGVGLAAPQIGRNIRLFIIGGVNEKNPMPKKVFINPELITLKGSRKMDWEGCLSVPKVGARVERWQKVRIKYYDTDFNEHIEMFKNFEARVIQHEFDHLSGIEFYDKIRKEELEKIIWNIEELRRGKFPDLSYEIETHKKLNRI